MPNTDWKPHPRQEEALRRIEFEILYGGARGGGKTDAGLVWLTDYISNSRYRALVIRKNADDLSDWVDRATRMYSLLGAKIAYRPAEITFPSGATIKTGHLKDDQAYTKYQGHEYQRMLIEELTQIPDEKRYLQLLASCRSTAIGITAQVFCTTNPGGIGHGWVKERFVDPAPPNTPFAGVDGRKRIYIPAKIDDNPTLLEADPHYVDFLEGLKATDVELWKAWRLGDWDTFAGQFFKEFKHPLHVCRPFIPDKRKVIVGGLDWGYNAPFAFSLSEVSRVEVQGVRFHRIKTFLEAYGTGKTAKEWSRDIKEKLEFYGITLEDIAWIQADPAIFNKGTDGSISIRDQFIEASDGWRKLKRGSNDRVSGWANMHQWLSIAVDGIPYYQISSNCVNGIKEFGAAVYDENKIEDLEAMYDHFLDQERYKLKALKWLDSKSGGVRQYNPNLTTVQRTAQFINTKQVSVNLDKWGTPNTPTGDSGVGGVRHS